MSNKIRTQVMLTKTLKYQVQARADKEGISFSEAVRRLLSKALETRYKLNNPADILVKLADSASPGGPKDLASNDEYLYGKDTP